ncbi:AraC family transcriptional regulator [Nonomuraea longispora]|uniref:AraC family transcriptional regulator n=1 Tax=Nonomuraea longispora TaxID=1848320 RepID=A0A4R4N2H7_9ACTN|nr:AraC family transcriptional regulator [Nonomuraea longispora]TDC02921.1 AraC family transcriptional regulator [Nonomuraea longispora]
MPANGVAIQFVRAAVDSTGTAGPDVRRTLDRPGATHVGCARTVEMMRDLWRSSGDELLSLGPRPIPPGTFRMISLGLIHAPDLRAALGRLTEFASITTGFSRSRLVVDDATCRVEIAAEPGVRVPQLAAEIVLALVHRFPAWLVARRIMPSRLELPFPEPPHSDAYVPVFGRMPVFDAPAVSISFGVRHLTAPVVRKEADLLRYLSRWPADLINHRDYATTTAARVRAVLERGGPGERTRADDVAARLSISAQHMRRLLRQEGTSFQRIREEVLRDVAVASLERGGESVEQISWRLGFSEPSAFRRAFTRWVGSPPGEYRARHTV